MPKRENLSENTVEKVLESMKERRLITHFLINKQNDALDVAGIDFLIFTNDGWALPLQVKTCSGKATREDKMQEHLRKHPFVKHLICIRAHLLESNPDQLYKEVERELKDILKI